MCHPLEKGPCYCPEPADDEQCYICEGEADFWDGDRPVCNSCAEEKAEADYWNAMYSKYPEIL